MIIVMCSVVFAYLPVSLGPLKCGTCSLSIRGHGFESCLGHEMFVYVFHFPHTSCLSP